MPKDSDYPQSSFMASIDDAAGRHKHKHERYQEISARTMDRSDAMEEELDAMLKQLAAEKTLRCSRKASVGLEGVGEWARVAGNKEVRSDDPLNTVMHINNI